MEIPSSSARPMGCHAWGTLNFGSLVIATLERLDCDWEPYSCTFLDCWLVCTAVLGKARGEESHWDMQVEQCDRAGSPVAVGWDMLCSLELSPVIFRGGRVGLQCLESRGVAEKCFLSRLWSFGIQLREVSEKLALPRKVDRPSSQGSPCHGGRVKVAVGLPAKDVFNHLYEPKADLPPHSKFERAWHWICVMGLSELPLRLWLADQFLISLSSLLAKTLSRREQGAELGVSYQDERKTDLGLVHINDTLIL
ncbi:hypothetical protein CRG98_042647 [Punica granatum]|uniref:Uncharacterized protein n=1 Tax=Punica granatum TaxID=22663 RepID=A0A2I0I0E7_PUNGR|nr:hypothetical protein CRG98_042647 [Punica granatum]